MKSKACYSCQEEKPITEFYKDKNKKDGLNHRCKICDREYHFMYRRRDKYFKQQKRLQHEIKQDKILNSKVCTKCKIRKPFDQFHKCIQKKDGYRSNCKVCRRKKERNYHRNNKDQALKRYNHTNLTSEMYDELYITHRVCAICFQECSSKKKLCVDHCHETNLIRGLLCSKCNMGLGNFNDSPELLESAIKYLFKHRRK